MEFVWKDFEQFIIQMHSSLPEYIEAAEVQNLAPLKSVRFGINWQNYWAEYFVLD